MDDIAVVCREDGVKGIGEDSSTRVGKDFGRQDSEHKNLSDIPRVVFEDSEHKNPSDTPSDVYDPRDGSLSRQNRGILKVNGSGELMGQTTEGKKKGPMSRKEHLRTRFYKYYQREAEEYDREFMKKYDEDLNTTLIFAGLFSAVTSAFIILVHADFQPDLNEETTALLRVVIYTMDNTAFGGNAPTVPQWTGPPRTSVQVQAILFASLSASLFSAFLAMLGKQWLNRCIPADMRGTIVERSQHRQRKLDGIVKWYFDHVLESLPLMLQVALLLLGCALSRYLWDINTIVASVVLGVTSFGVLFYLFIVIAGALSVNCPYQTPGANFIRHIPDTLGHILYTLRRIQDTPRSILRRILHISQHIRNLFYCVPDIFRHPPHVLGMLHSAFNSTGRSICFDALVSVGDEFERARRLHHGVATGLLHVFLLQILLLPLWFTVDACRVVFWLLAGFAYGVQRGLRSQAEQNTEQQTFILDLRCISWTLQTSLDEPVRLSALEYLATLTPVDPDPIQTVAVWFDILTSCVQVTNNNAMIIQGMEQPAATSSLFLLHTLSHLTVTDPMPKVLEDVRQRYTETYPFKTKFDGLPISHTLGAIHSVFCLNRTEGLGRPSLHFPRRSDRWRVQWDDYNPSSDTYITVARALKKLAWFEYQSGVHWKVPRWLLRFALHSLSQDPLPPTSVIADSLSIIAIDLGCNVSGAVIVARLDQRARILGLITKELTTLADACRWDVLRHKRKAITALFPYAVWQERHQRTSILSVFLRAAKASKSDGFLWHRVRPFVDTLLNAASHVSLKRAVILTSPYIPWRKWIRVDDRIQAWVATASAISNKEEVAPSVVDALLQIAHYKLLRPYNNGDVWSWLTLQPLLSPICEGRRVGSTLDVLRAVRNLNDIEILKSYLSLVWSEWDSLRDSFLAMCNSIREDFSGVEMNHHRVDLVQRLDHVLRQLDKGLGHLRRDRPELEERDLQERKEQYRILRTVFLEMNTTALEIP